MALTFDDASTDVVNHGSGSSLDNIAQGTLLFWIKPANLNTPFREIAGKLHPTSGSGINISRLSGNFRLDVSRTGGNQSVELSSADLTSGEWNFCGFTWDVPNGGPTSICGSLDTLAVDTSSGATNGSGTQVDDNTFSWRTGDADPSFTGVSVPADIARILLFNTDLSLTQIRNQQWRPHDNGNLVLWVEYGFNGTGTQQDLSGNGNNGTVTGATVANHVPLNHPFWTPTTRVKASTGDATVNATTMTVTTVLPTPTQAVEASPGTQTVAVNEQSPTAQVATLPSAQVVTTQQPSPVVTGSSLFNAPALNLASSLPVSTMQVEHAPNVLNINAQLITPTTRVTVLPAVLTVTSDVLSPTVTTGSSVNIPAAVQVASAVVPPAAFAVEFSAITLSVLADLLAPTVTTDGSAQVNASVQTLATTVNAPTLALDATITATVQTVSVSEISPVPEIGIDAAALTVTADALSPASILISSAVLPTVLTINATIPAPTIQGDAPIPPPTILPPPKLRVIGIVAPGREYGVSSTDRDFGLEE